MNRRQLPLLPAILLPLAALACGAVPGEEGVPLQLSGRVLTAAGEPPELAHVHLRRLADDEAVGSAAVSDDGSFHLVIPPDGLFELQATAVDHRAATVPLVLGEGAAGARLELTLAVNLFAPAPEKVRIFGDWNGWSYADGPEMERRGDGTFVHAVTGAGDRVTYQLIGATSDGRTVNGTHSDAYEYDDAGDYRSIVETDGGRVEIVFDPSRPPHQVEGLPRLVTADPTLSGVYALHTAMSGASAGGVFDDEEHRAAVAELPPDSPYWTLAAAALSRLDAAEYGELLTALADSHPDAEVRGSALAVLVTEAREAGDETRWRQLHGELAGYRGESRRLRLLAADLDPDRRIGVGLPVPAFEVALLGDGSVSSESLRGSTYLIDFWATWCIPCVEEMPELHEAWREYRDDGFQILSVSFDTSADAVQPFRDEDWAMPWLHGHVEDGFSSELAHAFEVHSIPRPILVDSRGTIVATHRELRGSRLLVRLSEVMGR